MSPQREASVALFALGNILHGDDGVGPCALEFLLSRWKLPADVVATDLGTPGPALVTYVLGHDRVVLIDAVRGSPPGELFRCEPGSTTDPPLNSARLSHDASILDAAAAAALGEPPTRIVVVGVRVERFELGIGLSRLVRLSVPALAQLAVDELVASGVRPEPRAEPLPLVTWWSPGESFAETPAIGA